MDATIAWLPQGSEARTAEQGQAEAARTALARWAVARGVRLSLPSARTAPHVTIDMTTSDRVETDLAHAKDALSAEDPDAADRALLRAEAILREHPETPNAAWQMAEVHRGWSSRWSRLAPRDEERARVEWQAAAALDGGRAAGVGERSAPHVAEIEATLSLEGEGEAAIDGHAVSSGPLHLAAGEHQLVVRRAGLVVWSEWVAFAPSAVVRVALPEAPPCSKDDLAHASALAVGGFRSAGVRCDDWVAVTSGTQPGRYVIAVCERDVCGTPFEWRSGADPSLSPATSPVAQAHTLPTWAKWTIIGAGVLAAGVSTTIAVTGAFHTQTSSGQFVSGGLNTTRFSFPVVGLAPSHGLGLSRAFTLTPAPGQP